MVRMPRNGVPWYHRHLRRGMAGSTPYKPSLPLVLRLLAANPNDASGKGVSTIVTIT